MQELLQHDVREQASSLRFSADMRVTFATPAFEMTTLRRGDAANFSSGRPGAFSRSRTIRKSLPVEVRLNLLLPLRLRGAAPGLADQVPDVEDLLLQTGPDLPSDSAQVGLLLRLGS